MNARRKTFWIVVGGATCLFTLLSLSMLSRRDNKQKATPFEPTVSLSASRNVIPDSQQGVGVTPVLVAPPEQSAPEAKEAFHGPVLENVPPPRDETTHQKVAAAIDGKTREAFKTIFGKLFEKLHLSADLQGKVIDILTQPLKQLEQQTFDAAQSGSIPTLPSPEALRAQQVLEDQQLRSVLGDAGFAQFDEYRAGIPERNIIDRMNHEGAELSDSQSQQVSKVLMEARNQIIGQAGNSQYLNSLSPDKAVKIMQQQQVLLQQIVRDRVQNILTPEQIKTLQSALAPMDVSKGP